MPFPKSMPPTHPCFLNVYHDAEGETGYQLFTDREEAREIALEFLSKCEIATQAEGFGNHDNWDKNAIWFATARGLNGSVTIYEITLNGLETGQFDFPCKPDMVTRRRINRKRFLGREE